MVRVRYWKITRPGTFLLYLSVKEEKDDINVCLLSVFLSIFAKL